MVSRSSREARGLSPIFAHVSIGSSIMFVVLLGLLHVLRPDLAPSWHFISEYEQGDFGWVMRAAFFSLALSCASLLAALYLHARGLAGRVGLLLLGVTAVGCALAGLYAPSNDNTLHETGAMLDQLPLAVLFITACLWRKPSWRPARRTLALGALALLGAMALFIGAIVVIQPSKDLPPSPDKLVGWPSRIFILAHCAWLIPVAWWAGRIGGSASAGTERSGNVAPTGRPLMGRVT